MPVVAERILVFNGYGSSNPKGPEVARWIKELRIRVALISELGRLDEDLRAIGHLYDVDERPKDCAVLVRGARATAARAFKVTPFVKRKQKPLLWRDRHVMRVRRWRKVYYAVHGNAAIQGPKGNWLSNEGAEEWREAMIWLHARIASDIDAGLKVRVGGDFNFRDADVAWSPNQMFDALGLDYISDGRVMWLAWDPRHSRVLIKRVLGIAPGADAHKALLVSLRRKTRR